MVEEGEKMQEDFYHQD